MGPDKDFIDSFRFLAKEVHATAKKKGWWDGEDRNDGELICLMHSELSEALEGLREGNPPDKHVPEFSSVEVELADTIVRIMDYAAARGYDVSGALVAKKNYNTTREHKHGGKKF